MQKPLTFQEGRLKIVSWNVNGLNALVTNYSTATATDKRRVLQTYFNQWQADIICFQEHKFSSLDKLENHFADIQGYDSFWSFTQRDVNDNQAWSGVVTFVRKGLTEWAEEGFDRPFEDREEGRSITTSHGSFILINIYAPNPRLEDAKGKERVRGNPRRRDREDRLAYKRHWFKELTSRVKEWRDRSKKKVIVCGDFNTTTIDADIHNYISYRETRGNTEEERSDMIALCKEGRLMDIWRSRNQVTQHPGKKGTFTYWETKKNLRVGNHGWRVDYFLIPTEMESLVLKTEIWTQEQGSDHCPIMLELKMDMKQEYKPPTWAANISGFKNRGPKESKKEPSIIHTPKKASANDSSGNIVVLADSQSFPRGPIVLSSTSPKPQGKKRRYDYHEVDGAMALKKK